MSRVFRKRSASCKNSPTCGSNRNRLSGPIPQSLAQASSLQVLRLDHNRLSGPLASSLAQRFTVFDASHNPELKPAR